jgi:hypothetical protein
MSVRVALWITISSGVVGCDHAAAGAAPGDGPGSSGPVTKDPPPIDAPIFIDASLPIDARAFADAPVQIDASPASDAPSGALPDLSLVADQMIGTTIVVTNQFDATSSEMVEGCIGAPGLRKLLQFDTVTSNLGAGDMVFGPPPPPGESSGVFVWSPCHQHHHILNYANYELIDSAGHVTSAHKQGFCLEDTTQIEKGASTRGYTCMNQGISTGWADSYPHGLPCQWIDVTDLPPGPYTLRVVVNPLHTIAESDLTNNEISFGVTL